MNTYTIPISVIVPLYNSGRYLEDSIKSINSGQWPAEILIIDDCSTDDSLDLAINLQSQYSNIRVLQREENGGAAEARRLGISSASQDLIALVDSDDLLETDALAIAYDVLTSSEADICIWELWRFDTEKKWKHDANPKKFPKTGRESVILTLGSWRIHPLGISTKALYQKAYQGFTEKVFNADELITRLVFSQAKKIVGCQKKYFYRVNPTSTTHTINARPVNFSRKNKLRSALWLLDFAHDYPEAPIFDMQREAISAAWFCWTQRKEMGYAKTIRELRFFLSKVFRFPRPWSWLLQPPKYFIALLILTLIAYCGTWLSQRR